MVAAHLGLIYFLKTQLLSSSALTVYGPGGDSRGDWSVLHPLRGGLGVFT